MSLDQQRARACIAGLVGLMGCLILSAFDQPPPDPAWYVFGTLVIGPLATGTGAKYREGVQRKEEE